MIAIHPVTTPQQLHTAKSIQRRVFSSEQGIPESDCMEGNDEAVHILALDAGEAVATARLLFGTDGDGEIARIAVLPSHRGAGIGHMLVQALEALAEERGLRRVVLHPHLSLLSFYAELGYARLDDTVDIVADHTLITMAKTIAPAAQQ